MDSWVTRRGVECVRIVNVRYAMKLCISCFTVESLIEKDSWV